MKLSEKGKKCVPGEDIFLFEKIFGPDHLNLNNVTNAFHFISLYYSGTLVQGLEVL